MKAWLVILLSVLPGTLETFADSFESGTKRLKENQERVDAALKSIGIVSESPTTKSDSGRPKEKIITQYSNSSRVRIAVGKLIFAKVINRLVVGADGSPVIVEFDPAQGWLSGLRMLGSARQSGVPGRISLDFKQLLFLDGRNISVSATAMDRFGAYGLEGQIFSQRALAIGGSIASSFVSGVAAAGQTQSSNAFGFSQTQVTGRNAILQGVAQTAADQSKRLIEESTQDKPYLVVEAGTEVTILNQEETNL